MIQMSKEAQYSAVPAVFFRYCELMGMTTEEYWDTQYESFLYQLTLSHFFEDLKKELFGDGRAYSQEEWDRLSEEYYEKLKFEYIILYE